MLSGRMPRRLFFLCLLKNVESRFRNDHFFVWVGIMSIERGTNGLGEGRFAESFQHVIDIGNVVNTVFQAETNG